ncbi:MULTISPECIES: ABC transporter substrate-binding protein [unclassified Bradyrhizobium]|uniref:ABC transporter substrate-binding protein n=1 Tax=unclassified Bradyrhizobium TaxID=2631580 RepID=UPI0020984AA3|nr:MULTISPECIES: ABC transporter substrate-binding protein [unclassified Bradyrhizobium]
MRDASHHHRFIGSLCSCGAHAPAQPTVEEAVSESVQQALLHGLFPQPVLRRELLRTVGAGVIIGALSSILPIDTLKAIAQERRPLEKTKLAVGFLPITCAVPLIYGERLGSYRKEGLDVSLQKIAGIALIRDKMLNGELDVSQQVMPVPLTMTAGLGGNVSRSRC